MKTWTSFCPDQSVASDFGTPQSHGIKHESGVINEGWCVRGTLSPGFSDCYFGFNVGQIYPVLICLLDA